VPADLRELVRARMHRLPTTTREALLAAAALARPRLGLVDDAAFAPAEERQLVQITSEGEIRFMHPL